MGSEVNIVVFYYHETTWIALQGIIPFLLFSLLTNSDGFKTLVYEASNGLLLSNYMPGHHTLYNTFWSNFNSTQLNV